MERVVVTGIGAITPFGVGMEQCYRQLIQGRTAIHRLESPEFEKCKCKIGATVPRENSPYAYNPVAYKVTDKATQPDVIGFAVAAATDALKDAQVQDYYPKDETGVFVSTGIGNINEVDHSSTLLSASKRLSPFFVPRILNNLPASNISIRFGLTGPCVSNNMACASAAYSLLEAFRAVRSGDCALALAGGSESCLGRVAYAGFGAMHALCTRFNEQPAAGSRPFDRQRGGFVMGEGAVVLVLESLRNARERGARILISEIGGFWVVDGTAKWSTERRTATVSTSPRRRRMEPVHGPVWSVC
ncbi:hypothetical protein WA588_005052 [Blastocystis sp. NMH]